MKRVGIFVLAIIVTVSLFIQAGQLPAHAEAATFPDIKGHWAESAIKGAVKKGYVMGYPDGSFRPNQTLTRAEFMKMLVAALGLETEADSNGKWYKPYIDTALTEGIYTIGDFANEDYDQPLTRAEMATVVVRATGEKEVKPRQGLYLATRKGLIGGTAPGEISAEGSSTRAQAIAVIERMLSVNAGKELPVDKYAVGAAEIYWHRTNIYSAIPELFNARGVDIEYWRESRMTLTSRDGNYKSELVELVAIDLSDPNDPNRKLLPPIDQLGVSYFDEEEKKYKSKKLEEISDYYVILLKSNLIHKKNNSYADDMYFNMFGFDRTQDKLSGHPIYYKGNENIEAVLLSKNFKLELEKNSKGKIYGQVLGFLDTPGGGSAFVRQQIISSYVYEE